MSASPASPSVIAWAITEDGRDLGALAARLDVEVEVLRQWMEGDLAPTRGQLTQLATTLSRPRSMFLLPSPPRSLGLPTQFRHPAGASTASISPGVRVSIRSARRIQRALSWALQQEGAVACTLPKVDRRTPTDSAAASIRDWLGLDVQEQVGWASEYAALAGWRQRFERQGVLTFQFELRGELIRGFSAWDVWAPLVVANSAEQTPQARIFTLAHELAHLATRTDATCLDWLAPSVGTGPRLEAWCDEFASSLLIPQHDLDSFLQHPGSRVGNQLALARRVASRYKVSLRASALRLIKAEVAPQALYGEVVAVAKPKKRATAGGASEARPAKRVRQYGARATNSLLDAMEAGLLPERDVADMLKVDYRELADISALARGKR